MFRCYPLNQTRTLHTSHKKHFLLTRNGVQSLSSVLFLPLLPPFLKPFQAPFQGCAWPAHNPRCHNHKLHLRCSRLAHQPHSHNKSGWHSSSWILQIRQTRSRMCPAGSSQSLKLHPTQTGSMNLCLGTPNLWTRHSTATRPGCSTAHHKTVDRNIGCCYHKFVHCCKTNEKNFHRPRSISRLMGRNRSTRSISKAPGMGVCRTAHSKERKANHEAAHIAWN